MLGADTYDSGPSYHVFVREPGDKRWSKVDGEWYASGPDDAIECAKEYAEGCWEELDEGTKWKAESCG